jgi:hypothetical protein
MMNPKARQEVQDAVAPGMMSQAQPGWGIVLWYDATRNCATVLMSQPGSDRPGEIYSNVPCPVQVGLQTVAPEPGRSCWVNFKFGNSHFPIVTSFFNYNYSNIDYPRATHAKSATPRFMMDM